MNIRDKIRELDNKVSKLQIKLDDPSIQQDIKYECAVDLEQLSKQLDKLIAPKPDET